MTRHAIIAHIMIATGILGTGAKVTEWTIKPAITQRLVKTINVGPNMCAGFKTAGLTN